MRVLYLGDTSSPHYRAWPAYFAAKGHDVHSCHVASCGAGPPMPGVTEHGPAARAPSPIRGAWLGRAASVARLRRSLRPDLVHSHQVVPSGYLAELAGADPHVATAWGSEVLLAGRLGRPLVGRVARRADLLTADSRHLLGALGRAGARPERLRWVPWGVDRKWAAPGLAMSRADAAVRAGLPADRPIVLSHRGPARVYRQDAFLRAMSAVVVTRPDALGVIPAIDRSAGRRDTARLRDQIARLGLGSSVEVVRPWTHEQMAFAFRAATVCVSVPDSDSAPTSVFEALAVGTPAIVSELPWLREPVHEEARLAVIGVGDDDALAAAVLGALDGDLDDGIEPNRDLVARRLDRETVFGAVSPEYERLVLEAP